MTDRERAIRDLAYRIWEEAGRPEGQGDRHWDEAQRRYDAERATVSKRSSSSAAVKDGKAKGSKLKKAAKPAEPKIAKAAVDKPAAPKTAKPKNAKNAKAKPAVPKASGPSSKTARAKKA